MEKTACVHFVGAGPGAEDLITLRGATALEQADVVVYAGSLVNPALLQRCKPECVCHNSASLSLDEQVAIMVDAALQGQSVVRLHTGDPALYGAIAEQMGLLARHGVGARVTPGVSSVFGAAAALGCELTVPGVSQSVVLTRTPGRTPMPEREQAAAFARTGATLAFFLSAGQLSALADELMHAGGLPSTTPAAVVYRATWPDERQVVGTLATIAAKAEAEGIGRQAMVFVGQALQAGKGFAPTLDAPPHESRLYDRSFSHGYRNTLADEAFQGACVVYAFTEKGLHKAVEVAQGLAPLPVTVVACTSEQGGASEQGKSPDSPGYERFSFAKIQYVPGAFLDRWLADHWLNHAAHIFVGATGIAVRKIAPLLQHKTLDPAVLVCTETGTQVISLVSGHLGGANRLARRVARITGGQAVISTASDSVADSNTCAFQPGRVADSNTSGSVPMHAACVAFDEAAAREKARVLNSEAIRPVNAALLRGDAVAFWGPDSVFEQYFIGWPHLIRLKGVQELERLWQEQATTPVVLWDREGVQTSVTAFARVVLRIVTPSRVLGVGCRRGVDAVAMEQAALDFLQTQGLEPKHVAALASCTLKKDEKALLDLAQTWNVPVFFHEQQALDAVPVPNPSQQVYDKTGTNSVAEAAALLSARTLMKPRDMFAPRSMFVQESTHEREISYSIDSTRAPVLDVPKTVYAHNMTFALVRLPHGKGGIEDGGEVRAIPGRVVVVGLGSGATGQISPEVSLALERCTVVAGYSAYVDLVRQRVVGKPCIESGMKGEVSRCRQALEAAVQGHEVVMVCSGDPGILAMAGLLFELQASEAAFAQVAVRVLPGITAASVAAAALGAPLQNGYSLISLSDLLVPADEIRANLRAAAQGFLPVALYNPAGRKRRQLLHEALAMFAAQRGPEMLCALVRHAGRPNEEKWVGLLRDFPEERVDMSTLVILGGPRTRWVNGALYEARGYAERYAL